MEPAFSAGSTSQKWEGEEEEDYFPATKGIQAGKGSYEPKKKRKKVQEKVEEEETKCGGSMEDTVCLDYCTDRKDCRSHSYCIVQSLKRKGIYPLKPKGFPWASGRLLYLPGQKPDIFGLMKEEIGALEEKKKKKKKKSSRAKKKNLQRLREGDHTKLCHVMNTTQELMLLMRMITIVMENKQIERRQRLADMQTESEAVIEEAPSEAVTLTDFETEGEEQLGELDLSDDK